MWNEAEDRILMKAEKQNWFPCHHVEKKFYSYSRRCIVLFFLRDEWAKTEQRIEMKNSTNGFALHWKYEQWMLNAGGTMNCIRCWRQLTCLLRFRCVDEKSKRFFFFFYSLKILGDHTAGVFGLDQTHLICLSCIAAASFYIAWNVSFWIGAGLRETEMESIRCHRQHVEQDLTVISELNYKFINLLSGEKFHNYLNRIMRLTHNYHYCGNLQ